MTVWVVCKVPDEELSATRAESLSCWDIPDKTVLWCHDYQPRSQLSSSSDITAHNRFTVLRSPDSAVVCTNGPSPRKDYHTREVSDSDYCELSAGAGPRRLR